MFFTRGLTLTLVALLLFVPLQSRAESVDELQAQIKAKQEQIQRLQDTAKKYEASLRQKQQERRTLANQLGILADTVSRTETQIESTQLSIESKNLEINGLEEAISLREGELSELKLDLGGLLRYMALQRSRSPLHTFFATGSFSDFYTSLQKVQVLQVRIGEAIDGVAEIKATLATQHDSLSGKRDELLGASEVLQDEHSKLEEQQLLKERILSVTQSSEKKFEALLQEAKREQEAANADVAALEVSVRQKLKEQGVVDTGQAPPLIWPVPKNRVTTLFRDIDYPFKQLFEHNAIDIRAAAGTTIRAPAAGYVAKVRTGSPKNYWYVVLIHDGNITTVFGHISKPLVSAGSFVTQGQPIALSGGLPNQPGSGPFSTGAHLHFEVHLNGSPVNPLNYLP
ncbi:MAG: peptidoglycan DD-metalloendopeptidase family protein [Patescibacteria group bacterium]